MRGGGGREEWEGWRRSGECNGKKGRKRRRGGEEEGRRRERGVNAMET